MKIVRSMHVSAWSLVALAQIFLILKASLVLFCQF